MSCLTRNRWLSPFIVAVSSSSPHLQEGAPCSPAEGGALGLPGVCFLAALKNRFAGIEVDLNTPSQATGSTPLLRAAAHRHSAPSVAEGHFGKNCSWNYSVLDHHQLGESPASTACPWDTRDRNGLIWTETGACGTVIEAIGINPVTRL